MTALLEPTADLRIPTLGTALLLAFALTALADEFDTMAVETYDDSLRGAIFEDAERWREVEGDENTWRLEPEAERTRRPTDRMRLLDDDRAFIGRRLYGSRSGRIGTFDPY